MTEDPRWARVDDLLERALELPPEERSAFLDAEVNDPELRTTLDAILAEERRTGFLDSAGLRARPIFRDLESALEERQTFPERLGSYRLLHEIGRGGMARVFLAERTAGGFDQKVAIKLIRSPTGGRGLRRRFEQERQILASLNHPTIARLLDGGETGGQPWFAMELVEGEPIEAFCRARGLGLRERLQLFRQVAEGVAYAHRNLVIHRDLKSSNVLVTEADHGGDVKLLDFGIAKIVEPATGDATATDQRPMTPEFASPEQVLGQPVTTASDVYQLGHLLYRLLSDRSPYQGDTPSPPYFHQAILTETPPLPSAAATQSRLRPTRTGLQGAVPWAGELRGDLDAIAMMALRKEPERRYATVAQLIDDLDAYLAGLVVRARPDSFGYRLRKLAGRHRAAVGVAIVAVVLLAVAGILFAVRLSLERDRALQEAQRANAVADFLGETFGASDPNVAQGEMPSARDLLDRGAERIESELAGQPEVQAALLETMGLAYRSLGLYEPAEKLLQQSLEQRRALLGERHPHTLRSAEGLGNVLWRQGRFGEAAEIHSRALELARESLGADHPRALSLANNLGIDWWRLGRFAPAEELLSATAESMQRVLGEDHRDTVATRSNLAGVLHSQGRFAEAAQRNLEVLESHRRNLGDQHDRTLMAMYNLGLTYRELGRFGEARPLLEESVEGRRRIFGDDHQATLASVSGLASLYAESGQLAEAIRLHSQTLDARRRVLGESHRDTLSSIQNLAATHFLAGDVDAAIPLLRENHTRRSQVLGAEHPGTLRAAKVLAQVLLDLDEFAEAEQIFAETLETYSRTQSPDHRVAIEMTRDLGRLYCQRGADGEGLALVDNALERARTHFAGDALLVGTSLNERGRCLTRLGRHDEAEAALLVGHSLLDEADLPAPQHEERARAGLVELYVAWGREEEAERWREQAD